MSGLSFLGSCVAAMVAGFAVGFLSAWLCDLAWQHVNGLVDAYIQGLQLYSVPELWR